MAQPGNVPQQPVPNRMKLGAVVTGRIAKPIRVLLYGVEGIGKSTFGASAPGAIFLGAEDGTAELDVTRFPTPGTWVDVMDAVRTLENDPHEFQSLVVDTLDWVEPMLWAHICARDGQKDIEAYGYGKGYVAALDEWRVFLVALERLRASRGMHVVMLAHSSIRPFRNPEGDDFDRYELKLKPNAAGLLKEWNDAVLFANYQTFAEKDSKTKRVKGISTGARLIYTNRTAAYDAKNRYSLPDPIPLSWEDFHAAVFAHRPAAHGALIETINGKLDKLDKLDRARAQAAFTRAGVDSEKLAQLNDWINAKLNLKEA